MPDRVVALQLLSSYWLAVILPPLPGILCFSAIYNNERISAFSSALSPYAAHQGRKFGGYKILPKPCKNSSSTEKDSIGVCMFNYECTQRAGTIVGSCMDGFLYGTCCKLPPGVSLSTVDVPDTTSSSKPYTFPASERSTVILKPHIEHSPEETFLLYKNGTVVQNVYSPNDYLSFTKYHTPSASHTSPLPDAYDTKVYANKHKITTDGGLGIQHSANNISPSQIFDLAMSFTNTPSSTNDQQDRFSTIHSSTKPYTTTFSSREPFSPNFASSKYSPSYSTKIPLSQFTTNRTTDYFSNSNKYGFSTVGDFTVTNKNDLMEDDEENLIRVPTLTAESMHNKYGNNSIDYILWLLNDTKVETEPDTDLVTQPTQSFYTWLSVQNNAEKTSLPYFSTRPVTHSSYHHENIRPNTLPSTTVHHIPGPSFQVTPEVKITPKPPGSVGEVAPTVIVLSPAPDTSSPPTKKPVYNYSTTASYNVSYHYPSQTGSSSKPFAKPAYSPGQLSDKPPYNFIITAKPSSARPGTPAFAAKPPYSSDGTTSKPSNHLYSPQPIPSSPISVHKPVNTVVTSTLQTKIKPQTEAPTTTSSFPSILQSTVVTTAKPVFSSNANVPDLALRPLYPALSVPSYTNPMSTFTTSTYVTVRPPSSGYFGVTPQTGFENNPTYSLYPPGTNMYFNSTKDDYAFPPDRNPNVNLTATQQEIPVFTVTTMFDNNEEAEVTPQFAVDKTLEDKMHVFVEKIVQSLQGNFEDLEKVLISGESTNNITVSNGSTKKPVSKKPTKKPSGGLPTKPTPRPKPGYTLPIAPQVITKKPAKKPSLATPVSLFQPSTSQTTINIPTKKPIKVTSSTTISIYPPSSPAEPSSLNVTEEEEENEHIATSSKPSTAENIDYTRACGIRPLAKKNGRIVGGKGSTFGEWPWQVLVREATWLGLFTKNKCGGVLITNKYVITAAHCQPGVFANLVAVFGEYDISGEVESKRSISKNVRRVIVHRQYNSGTFENDISLLELESPIQFDSHIVPICMPEDDDDFTGRMATVTGWGRLKYGGGVPSVLQEVQVPVIENRVCQEMFENAGHSKIILSSFLCAGYANGLRDSCEGDSGGPLMLERDDGHWVLVATVSHGIKCAAPYLPGVYMRTTYYKPWLQTITGVQ